MEWLLEWARWVLSFSCEGVGVHEKASGFVCLSQSVGLTVECSPHDVVWSRLNFAVVRQSVLAPVQFGGSVVSTQSVIVISLAATKPCDCAALLRIHTVTSRPHPMGVN